MLLSSAMLVAWGTLTSRGAIAAPSPLPAVDMPADTAVAAPDTSVDVIAYFCKRDTTSYTYEHSRIKIKGADTTVVSSMQEDGVLPHKRRFSSCHCRRQCRLQLHAHAHGQEHGGS